MPRLRLWSSNFWIVSLLVISPITCVAQAPKVEPVTDQETELGQAMYAKLKDNVEIIEGDITDPSTVREAVRGVELVFHQAAIRITQCAEEPRMALEVLVDGAFNVVGTGPSTHLASPCFFASLRTEKVSSGRP